MKPTFGAIVLVVLAICCPLDNTRADDAPATVTFDTGLKEYLAQTISIDGFDNAVIGNTDLPTKTVWLPLMSNELANDLRFTVRGVEQLGSVWVDGGHALVSTSSDFPYEEYVVSAEEDARVGRDAVMVEEVIIGGDRFARIQLFPIQIEDMGEFSFVSSIGITVGGREVTPEDLLTNEQVNEDRKSQRFSRAAAIAPEYLIITNDDLKPAFDRLAAYKNATGITTECQLIDDVLAGQVGVDDAERLREYLKRFYTDGGYYVLLAGDETVLPVRYAYHRATSQTPAMYDLQICDLYFADVDGQWDFDGDGVYGEPRDDSADVYPDLALGRVPFNAVSEANAYVDKLIAYETNPGNGDFSYLTRAFFYAADQLRDYGTNGQHGLIAATLPLSFTVDTTTGVEAMSGLDPAPSNVEPKQSLDTLATGFGLVNILVHGRTDGFATKTAEYNLWPKSYVMSDASGDYADLDSLPSNNKVGLWYTLACDMGGFDMDQPPFSNPNQNIVENALSVKGAGAVAFVAYSRWGWVSSSHLLLAAMYESMAANPDRPAIEAMYASKAKYYYYRDLVYGQNFYGDPTVRIYQEIPQAMDIAVTHDVSPTVTVTANGQPVSGNKVLISDSLGVIGSLTTDANGQATIDFSLDPLTTYHVGCRASGATAAYAVLAPSIVTDVDNDPSTLPRGYDLGQNYPNPFNPTTSISFYIDRAAHVELTVYNVLGQQVANLIDEPLTAGEHVIEWDSRDGNGRSLASGVYVYRLQTDQFSAARKMLLVK